MRVRQAVLTDLPAVAAVGSGSVEGSERWAELHHLLTHGWVLLAEDLSNDSPLVVGYVAVAPQHFFGRDFIALLVVAEACRRRGIGRQLLRAATLRATSEAVFTSTNESNHPMLELLMVGGVDSERKARGSRRRRPRDRLLPWRQV